MQQPDRALETSTSYFMSTQTAECLKILPPGTVTLAAKAKLLTTTSSKRWPL